MIRMRHRAMRVPASVSLGMVIVATLLTGCTSTPSTGTGTTPVASASSIPTAGRATAEWHLAKGFTPTPETKSLRVDIRWQACASGVAVADPMPVVGYSASQVTLTVWGILPPNAGRAADCQLSETTTIDVPLAEPVGSRSVVAGSPPGIGWPI